MIPALKPVQIKLRTDVAWPSLCISVWNSWKFRFQWGHLGHQPRRHCPYHWNSARPEPGQCCGMWPLILSYLPWCYSWIQATDETKRTAKSQKICGWLFTDPLQLCLSHQNIILLSTYFEMTTGNQIQWLAPWQCKIQRTKHLVDWQSQ